MGKCFLQKLDKEMYSIQQNTEFGEQNQTIWFPFLNSSSPHLCPSAEGNIAENILSVFCFLLLEDTLFFEKLFRITQSLHGHHAPKGFLPEHSRYLPPKAGPIILSA